MNASKRKFLKPIITFLDEQFVGMAPDPQKRRMAIERFERVIESGPVCSRRAVKVCKLFRI